MRHSWGSVGTGSGWLPAIVLLFGGTISCQLVVPTVVSAEPSPDDPLQTLNRDFRKTYRQARAAALARSGPVILVDSEQLVLFRGTDHTTARAVPALYNHLKAVAHVPLAVYLLLDGPADEPIPTDRLGDMQRMHRLLTDASAVLAERGFNAAQLKRQEKLIEASLAILDVAARRQRYPGKKSADFAQNVAPLVIANIEDAARVQIDGYHAQVVTWRRDLTPAEWGKLRVVVAGSQMPRKGHVAVQYFARLLGEAGEGQRIVYAEALYDEQKALDLLGTHLLDSEIARVFFGDPRRMDRDLLGDAAAEYLRTFKTD